jgi:hypothetical protein
MLVHAQHRQTDALAKYYRHIHSHTHTRTHLHTLELWSRRVWGLTIFRPLSSLDLRYNKLTELPSFPGFSSLRSLVCMGDGVCVCVCERESVFVVHKHTHTLSVWGRTRVFLLCPGLEVWALNCVLQCAHTHAHTHKTSYAQHIMQRAIVYVSSFTNLRT